MICYNDQTRLRTAVELLNATKDIESQLDKVSSALVIFSRVAGEHDIEFLYEKISVGSKVP